MIIKHGGHSLTRCAKVCGLHFLDCAFRALIGWAGELRSRGYYILEKQNFTNFCSFYFRFLNFISKCRTPLYLPLISLTVAPRSSSLYSVPLWASAFEWDSPSGLALGFLVLLHSWTSGPWWRAGQQQQQQQQQVYWYHTEKREITD